MVNKFIACGLAMLAVGLIACSVPTADAYTPKQAWLTYPAPLSDSNRREYDGSTFTPYPVKVVIDGLRPGLLIDTWLTDGKPFPGYPDYYWNVYDPMAIAIHNQHPDDTVFSLSFVGTLSNTTDADTGLVYSPTPLGAEQWVIIASPRVIVPPNAIVHVPIAILTPRQLPGLPDRWEFVINIKDEAQTGPVVTSVNIRFLITMGQYKPMK